MARPHPRLRFSSIVAILAFAAFVMPALVEAAVAPMFSPLATGTVSRQQFDIKSVASPIVVNRAALARLAVQDEMEFVLPNATRYTVVFDRIEDHGGGIQSSIGYLKDFGRDFRVITTTGPSGTFGSIRTPETTYQFTPGRDHDFLVDMSEEKKLIPKIHLGNDADPGEPHAGPDLRDGLETNGAERPSLRNATPGKTPAVAGVTLAEPNPQVTIDVMFVYTRGLANRLGTNLLTRFYQLVATANTAYFNSEVAIRIRLVNAMMVDYPDSGSDSTALNAIRPLSAGDHTPFTNVYAIRDQVGADLVAFLRDGGSFSGSGIASLTKNIVTGDPDRLYSVVTGCVVGCDSVFVHELGHNMGNAHDRATAAAEVGGTATPPSGAFAYSFGNFACASGVLTCNPFTAGGCGVSPNITLPACSPNTSPPDANNFGTIMSYFDPEILKFSNPALTCVSPGGASRPCGITDAVDNARSMNQMRIVLRDARPSVVAATPPGALQFSATSFSASESTSTVTISVNRVGGSGGSVSVNYSTADGSAKAGFDYASTSGTLTWPDGDATTKTFVIPIVNDAVTEGGESFTVLLSNPTGPPGIFLGNPIAATVLIAESWPPGGSFPTPNYSTPGASNGSWTTATDFAFEGTTSLRSAATVATTSGVYRTSDLLLSGTIPAGNISFQYRVSTLNGFGLFEFLVDGVTVLSTGSTFTAASPEAGNWRFFNYVLSTGGSHTLIWRFRNSLSFACGNAIDPTTLLPAAPDGVNCADRAWIDSVAIPLPLATSSTSIGSSSNPSIAGQSITFTANVTGGSGMPAGAVTFRDGANITTGCNLVLISGGSAQCTTSALTAGSHSITAAYSGNTTYDVSTSAALTQTVNIGGTVPGAPTIGAVTPGNGLVTVNFTQPASNGGQPITSYSATCSPAGAVSGMSSPIVVTGLKNGTQYSCSVTATNVIGTGAASGAVNVTPRTVPGAPNIISATPGNTQTTIAFAAPVTDGGAAITSYMASCVNAGTVTGSGTLSPIVVSPLNNGVTYSCSVAASNVAGTGASSGTLGVTPAALALISAASRKNHPGFGNCDVPIAIGIPVGGQISVEPRTFAGAHVLALNFNAAINSVSTISTSSGSATLSGLPGTTITATLTGIADNQRVNLTLNGLNGSAASASLALGFLVGDVSGSRVVNATDIAAVKAQSGLALNPGNCRMDLNVTGIVSSTDISAAKARSGTALP